MGLTILLKLKTMMRICLVLIPSQFSNKNSSWYHSKAWIYWTWL